MEPPDKNGNILTNNNSINNERHFLPHLPQFDFCLRFLGAFIWAIRSGQFDDDYTPSVRMLFDDEKQNEKSD